MRRRFVCGIVLCFGISCLSAQEKLVPLTILHTNDLHAHLVPNDRGMGGFAYLAAVVREQREHCPACIYLNAGDLVQGTPVSTMFRGAPVYEIANHLGIDAATLGNHEFDYGWKRIQTFQRIAKYPLISANVAREKGELLTGKGYVIKTVGGLRVGVIGVLMGDLKGNFTTAEETGPWNAIPVLDAIRETIPSLRPNVDIIIVTGHIHDDETNAILRQFPEVAVVVAGHDHKGYPAMKHYDGRYAVEVKGYGVEVGRLDLKYDLAARKVASAEWSRIPVDSKKITPAKDVAGLVAFWEAKVSKVVDVPVAEATRRLEREELRKLVERAMAEETGADIAWVNKGNLRDAVPQGTVLARNIWNVLPFDNKIVTGKFKGSELPEAVTRDFPVIPDKVYTLAVTDFTAANQGSPDQLGATGLKFPKTGPLQRDAVLDWVRKKKVLGQ